MHVQAFKEYVNSTLLYLFCVQINCALNGEYSRDQSFLDVAPHLFTSHHYHQLGGQLNQTATRVTLNVG